MNGVHDLGGMHGLGAINPEPNEPVFHHDWERAVFGDLTTNPFYMGQQGNELNNAMVLH